MAEILLPGSGERVATELQGDGSHVQKFTTRVDKTWSAPTSAVVTGSSAQLVASNAGRKGLLICNNSGFTIWIAGSGNPAEVGKGIPIFPNQLWTMTEYTFSTGAISAISEGASSNVSVQELT